MSKKEVPAKVVYTCDRCEESGIAHEEGPFMYSAMHMTVQHWARGYDGATGGCTYHYDLCGNCADFFKDFMDKKSITC